LAAEIATYEKFVQRNPRDVTAANSLGDLYVRAGRIEEAVSVFSTIAEHLCAEGYLLRALALLKKVIKLEPGLVEALTKLAELSERLGRKAEAIEFHALLATACEGSAQPQKPLEVYNPIAQISPSNPSTQIEPGDVLEVAAPLDQADLSEDEFVIKQIFRAEVLAIRGGFDEAIAILREILSFAPDNVPARSKLKDVFLRAGLADLAANECLQLARIRESRKMDAIAYLEDELEFGPIMSPPPSRELALFDENPDLVPGFEFFAKPPLTMNRRNVARISMSLPVLVISDDGGWREFAESINVSRSGILLRLGHSVNPATTLRATMPMPVKLRSSQSSKGLYVVSGVVRHALPDPGGDNLVGIEFEVKADASPEPRGLLLDCSEALTSE
jgi:tetratricopeptide (TPR) repeat protein